MRSGVAGSAEVALDEAHVQSRFLELQWKSGQHRVAGVEQRDGRSAGAGGDEGDLAGQTVEAADVHERAPLDVSRDPLAAALEAILLPATGLKAATQRARR